MTTSVINIDLPNGIPRSIYVDTQFAAVDALQAYVDGHRRTDKPGYAKAVIHGYAQSKLKKGRSLADVDKKLHELGKAIIANNIGPFAVELQEARDELHQGASRVASDSVVGGPSSTSTNDAPAPPYWNSDEKNTQEKHNH